MRRLAAACLAALALSMSACGFGVDVERPNPATVVENLGQNRYIYHSTRLVTLAARDPASPVLSIAPPGAREIGLIEVTSDTSGFGPGGLRGAESQFFARLGEIAGAMGGTHFMVLRTSRDRSGTWITAMTVDVLAAP